MTRTAARTRSTKETSIDISIDLDGTGVTDISTGIPFYDHMLDQLGRHGGFDLVVHAEGDIEIDTHHTVEDVAITLGEVFAEALGDKAGVRRFASGRYPLDEALIDIALDLSGRPHVDWHVEMPESLPLGTPAFDPQLAEHVVSSFATAAGITLHVELVHGRNTRHIIEATSRAWPEHSAMRCASKGPAGCRPRRVCCERTARRRTRLRHRQPALGAEGARRGGADARLTADPELMRYGRAG